MIPVEYYLGVGFVLFFIGLVGVIARRNVFTIFMSIELMLNAVNLLFVSFAKMHANMDGHAIAMIVMALAAAEAAFGLAIIIIMYKSKESLDIDLFRKIRG